MITSENIILLSIFLFSLGFLGILRQPNIIKTFISLEIMIFASIVNFAYFSGNTHIRSGHFAILIMVVLSGLVLSIIFTILNFQAGENKNILDEEKED